MAKHGDAAAEFLWKYRAVLTGGAALTAFLANPEPFLHGTRDIASVAGEAVVKPVVGGAFSVLNTALIVLGVLLLAVVGLAYKYGLPKGTGAALLSAVKAPPKPGVP